MVFSSIKFLLFFLPIFLILYGLAPEKIKNPVLLAGSLIFYALGDLKSLPLLMASVLVNYFFGLRLESGGKEKAQGNAGTGAEQKGGKRKKTTQKKYGKSGRERKRRALFIFSILFNVGILTVFKYVVHGTLPLGISFYTFQVLSYLIDVYWGEEEKETSFVCFATYIVMFPQLVSGPIVRYTEVRKALYARKFTARGVQEGLKIFTLGLAAKVLLADTVGALWGEVGMTGYESISTQLAWMGAIAYSMKIYFDFCGYSLMAVGLGRMLGFELPMNFRTPYMATTVRDFYRRWHMTLGRWFSRYIYIPLGGNRKGMFRTALNLLAVWLLTGVWHGNTVNFLLWGMILWLAIVIERQLEAAGLLRLLEQGPGRIFLHLYLWVIIPLSWMCFEIVDVQELQIYLGRMFGLIPSVNARPGDWLKALEAYWWLLLAGFAACLPMVMKLFKKFKDTLLGGLILAALFWLCVWRLQMVGDNPFMYRGF